MLQTRIITAIVMLAVFLPAVLFLPSWYFSLFLSFVVALAFWEWGQFLQFSSFKRKILGVAAFLFLVCFSFFYEETLQLKGNISLFCLSVLAISSAFWCLVAPIFLHQKWKIHGLKGMVLGIVILFPLWLSVVQMRNFSVELLLLAMLIVWIADSVAYFVGKACGKHKMCPSISPGKSWEGALGGILGVMLYFLFLSKIGRNVDFHWLVFLITIFLGGIFAALSIVGDLLESLFKRQANLKDSSQLLPGHGGFLDRFDSLAAVLPSFWLMFYFWIINA